MKESKELVSAENDVKKQKKTGGGSLLNLFKLSAAPQLPPPDVQSYLKPESSA